MNHKDLLERSVPLLQTTLSGSGHLKINLVIKCQVDRLAEEFNYDFDEIVNCQVETILTKNLHRKYKPGRSLSTFITHTTNYGLKHQIRKESQRRQNRQEISIDGILADQSEDTATLQFLDEMVKPGFKGFIDRDTPEDLCIARELLGLVLDHFGAEDAKVILGIKDRKTQANHLGISYQAYCKRLQRQLDDFIAVLKQHGYDI